MRIKIYPSFMIYLLCIALLSSLTIALSVLSALLIHEIGHYIACKLIGEQIDLLELTPLGGIMRYKPGTISSKGIKGVCVHAAGPLGNYAVLVLNAVFMRSKIPSDLQQSLFIANVSMLLLNLLPAFPLDGGQIVFCLGYYILPVNKLVFGLSSMGMIIGFSGLLMAIYGFMRYGILNCSLLIVSTHMIFSASRQRRKMLAENLYTVVQERLCEQSRVRKIIHYQVAPETTLYELIGFLKQQVCVSVSFVAHGQIMTLDDRTLCHALLTQPSNTVHQVYLNMQLDYEKSLPNHKNTSFTP